jgi:SAM-dependent methyltransferase
MSKQAEREYAYRIDPAHLFLKPFNDPRVFREFAVVLELFGKLLGGRGRLLDVGCGPGWTSLFLARAGYDVVGVDISERMIEIARERSIQENTPAEFLVGDMEDLDPGCSDFDGALFFDCLHHCPAYSTALKRVCDLLRHGGHVLLLETTWLHHFSPHARQVSRDLGVTELGFTRRQLRRALQEAGFHAISFHHDPGACYQGFAGFLKAGLRLGCGYLSAYPQVKNIVLARKD